MKLRRVRAIAVAIVVVMSGGAVLGVLGLGGGVLSAYGSSTKTGTENFSGSTTSSANNPTIPLKASGVFTDTGSFVLGNGKSTKGTLDFSKGKIDVTHSIGNDNAPPTSFNAKTCHVVFESPGTFTVTGGTGTYEGATGHGSYKVTFSATLPKLKNGKCNESNNAQPVAGSSLTAFEASGTLTIK
jgi:hypothetical protein